MIKDPASLEYQTAIIPLRQGMDTKTAEQVVDAPAMLALSNASLHAPGEIAKDRGYAFLTMTDLAGVALPQPFRRVIEHNSAQLIMGRDNLCERVETTDTFHTPSNRTAIASSAAERLISLDINATPGAADSASLGEYDMLAAIYGTNLRVLVRERATGAIMSTLVVAVTPAAGQAPVCVACATTTSLVCVWADGANLRATRWNTALPGTPLSAAANIAVNVNAATKYIDAVSDFFGQTFYVAYTTTTPLVMSLRVNATTLASTTSSSVAGTAAGGIGICIDTNSAQLVAWAGAPGLSVFGAAAVGGAPTGNSLLAAGGYDSVTCISNENATARGTVFAYNTATNGTVRHQCAFAGGGGSLASATLFGWSPTHKPVLIDALIWVGYQWRDPGIGLSFTEYEFTANTTVHRADNGQVSTADPVCWYMYGLIAGLVAAGRERVSSMSLVGAEYRWVSRVIDPIEVVISGLATLKLRPYAGQAAPLRRMPLVCDAIANGQTGFFSASFGSAPVVYNTTEQNVAAGLVPGATYNWIFYYDLLLPDGTRVQSLTSGVTSITITGLNDQVQFTVAATHFRSGLVANLRVARTLADGTIFHLLPVLTGVDSRTAHTVTVVDGTADSVVSALPLLYTTGEVLDAYPAPSTQVLVLHQGRMFGYDENSNQIRYTREILAGEAPAWHPNLSLDCTGTNMDPRALITSPSGLWVLGRDRQTGSGAIALLLGSGPADDGSGSTYELQRLENCDVGPAEYRHAVATPLGILFVDPNQGFHLLPTGGGAPVFVGAPIEDLRGSVVNMHVLLDRKVVRVTQNAGITSLDWHYDQNQWSTRGQNSGVTITDTAMWDGRHALQASFAMARQENAMFSDPIAGYQVTTFTTAWVKTAGFSGLQRIWRMYLLGRNIAPHGLTISLQYDYNTSVTDTYTFTEAEVTAAVATGKYEFRVSPRRQLCESFRVIVADTAGSSGSGQGAAWVALRLEYGALRASSRKAGVARKS